MDTRGVRLTRLYLLKGIRRISCWFKCVVDDIIFGSTKKSWCDKFESLMESRFQMSSMGELTFFLGLQVKQNTEGIFISQDKYIAEILKKFDLVSVKTTITPMETKVALTKDEEAVDVDVTQDFTSHALRETLITLRANPKLAYGILENHLLTIIDASLDSDYEGSNLIGKSTIGNSMVADSGRLKRYALTTNPTIYDSLVKQFWQTATAKTLADGTLELHATIDTIVYIITEASIRNKLQLADASGITMLPNNEIFEGMGHMGYPTDDVYFGKAFHTPNRDS
ncbi:putative ribonuclease H-like domain-containing protein [Tanacetum coccineum]